MSKKLSFPYAFIYNGTAIDEGIGTFPLVFELDDGPLLVIKDGKHYTAYAWDEKETVSGTDTDVTAISTTILLRDVLPEDKHVATLNLDDGDVSILLG